MRKRVILAALFLPGLATGAACETEAPQTSTTTTTELALASGVSEALGTSGNGKTAFAYHLELPPAALADATSITVRVLDAVTEAPVHVSHLSTEEVRRRLKRDSFRVAIPRSFAQDAVKLEVEIANSAGGKAQSTYLLSLEDLNNLPEEARPILPAAKANAPDNSKLQKVQQ